MFKSKSSSYGADDSDDIYGWSRHGESKERVMRSTGTGRLNYVRPGHLRQTVVFRPGPSQHVLLVRNSFGEPVVPHRIDSTSNSRGFGRLWNVLSISTMTSDSAGLAKIRS